MKKLSIIVPCFNESEVLQAFYDEITKVAAGIDNFAFEFLFVNDGSRDSTQNIIENFAESDERVKFISFSRNFGKEAAMLAGLENCTGDYACIMDADLQHSPDLIPEMLKAVDEEGYDVAACRRVDREGEAKLKSLLSGAFYKVVNLMTETYIDDGAQDYRIMNRNVVDSILSMQESIRFTKGIFSWVGFNTKWFPHHNRERAAGETKWSLSKLMKYAFDGIIGYTSSPLRLPLYLGILSLAIGFVYTVVLIILAVVNGGNLALGIAAATDAVIIMGGLVLLSMGIAGEYLSRIYTEVKGRPKYLVAKTNCKK